jgi:hypothetical protein
MCMEVDATANGWSEDDALDARDVEGGVVPPAMGGVNLNGHQWTAHVVRGGGGGGGGGEGVGVNAAHAEHVCVGGCRSALCVCVCLCVCMCVGGVLMCRVQIAFSEVLSSTAILARVESRST